MPNLFKGCSYCSIAFDGFGVLGHTDFARFGVKSLNSDLVALMHRRVYDMAALVADAGVEVGFGFF